MKIIMFSEAFGGNTTTFINNEIKYLSQNHELKFLCTKKIESGIFNYDNVDLVEYKPNKIVNKLKWWLWQSDLYLNFYNRTFSKNVNEVVEKFKPDVIHCHFAYEALMLLDNLNDIGKYIIVIHFHGYDASSMLRKKSYVKKLQYYLSKENIYSIVVSKQIRSNLKEKGIDVTKSKKLHCGIDISLFSSNNKENKFKNNVFLQVSSLAEKKGHEYTLQAFSRFIRNHSNSNFVLQLTGGGDRMKVLRELSKDLGIESKIQFLGFVSPQEAKELMQNADFFIHHSITSSDGDQEGIPTAIMEAMAMELPILTTKHAGIPELVEDGINGYLVDEKDIDALAKRMEDILSWDKLPNNRKVIEERFNYITHNLMLEEFYKNIYFIQ